MTCSILSFQKFFLFFHQLTRLMIRWLAGESIAFQQLTGCKIALCTGESSALAQNELSPPKLWFYQKLSVSLPFFLCGWFWQLCLHLWMGDLIHNLLKKQNSQKHQLAVSSYNSSAYASSWRGSACIYNTSIGYPLIERIISTKCPMSIHTSCKTWGGNFISCWAKTMLCSKTLARDTSFVALQNFLENHLASRPIVPCIRWRLNRVN